MKTLLKFVVACVVITNLAFNASFSQTVKTPQPSPTQTLTQDFGLGQVKVVYSRPQKKDRVIMGDLVPYGDVWRTGANASTKITFTDAVSIEGQAVPAGTYALYTIPNKAEWTIIIHKNLEHWGSDGYSEKDDLIRVKVNPIKSNTVAESFTIDFDNVRSSEMLMNIKWDKTTVPVKITTDIDTRIMADIDKAMQAEKKPYFTAASYYFENGKDLKKALEWADAALKLQPDAFYIEHLKAKIQLKTGDKSGAVASAQNSIKTATAAKNNDYVKLNEKLITTAGKK